MSLLASDEGRDAVATSLGDLFVWVFGTSTGFLTAVCILALIWVFWALSRAFGPHKLCSGCKGKGYRLGLFGGVRVHKRCGGRGYRPRVGSGD